MAIKLINHTPISFPLEYPQGVREPPPPGHPPAGEPAGLWFEFWYGESQLHHFCLEIKKTGIDRFSRVTRVFIVVNRQDYELKKIVPRLPDPYRDITGGSENWGWDSPDHLVPEYRYGFAAETKSLFNPRTPRVTRYPEQGSFRTGVALHGLVSWFTQGNNATNSPNGELWFGRGSPNREIFVQNLTPTDAIWSLTFSGQNPDLFGLATYSSSPGPLNHGDIVPITVVFSPGSALTDAVYTANLDLIVSVPGSSNELLKTRFVLFGDNSLIWA